MKKKALSLILVAALVCAVAVPASAAIPSKSSLQDRMAYYATIQDWDAYDEVVRQLKEYYPENDDNEEETISQPQEPSTKPETPTLYSIMYGKPGSTVTFNGDGTVNYNGEPERYSHCVIQNGDGTRTVYEGKTGKTIICTEEEFHTLKDEWDKEWEKVRKEKIESELRNKNYYADVPSDAWYAEAVNAMTEGDLLNGYSDGLFHPNDYVTQGQFAKILTDIYNVHPHTDESSMPAGCEKCGYSMATHTTYATEHWALKYAWDACSTGEYVLSWCGCTLDYPVWRGDAIKVATNIAKHMSKYYDYENSQWRYETQKPWTESDIPDWNIVPNDSIYDSWKSYSDRDGHYFYASSILTAYNLGITHGIDNNGTCGFFNPMTRAELCQMLYNMGITRKGQVRN